MTESLQQARVIAAKEVSDALRTRLVFVLTGFLLTASLVALTVAALALRAEVAAYESARETLLALGKPASAIAPPTFRPLLQMRAFVEYVEIIGAVLGITLGYRAAAIERGRNTLALILTRTRTARIFLVGKVLGNSVLIFGGLAVIFTTAAIGGSAISGVALTLDELARLATVLAAAGLYVFAFFLMGFLLMLFMRSLPRAILTAFALWLALVLVAPQIGDTLDPDNQVAGGVFNQLGIKKPQQVEILKSFATYETLRTGIEAASPAKHFERLSFAVLGIKNIYFGQSLANVLHEKQGDIIWLIAIAAALSGLLFACRLDFTRLAKD